MMGIQSILDHKGSGVITISRHSTLKDAAEQMVNNGIAALVVTSGDVIVGITSEREIVHAIARHGEAALAMPVMEAFAPGIFPIDPQDSLKHAMNLMTRHRVRHLPVVDDGKLIGIVSIGDIIKRRVDDLEMESNVLRDVYIAAR
jgi:CBS domain-containing protein